MSRAYVCDHINISRKSGNGKMVHIYTITVYYLIYWKSMLRFAAREYRWLVLQMLLAFSSVKAFRVKIEFSTAFKWFLSSMKRINFHYSYSNNRKWNGTKWNGSEESRVIYWDSPFQWHHCKCARARVWVNVVWCNINVLKSKSHPIIVVNEKPLNILYIN